MVVRTRDRRRARCAPGGRLDHQRQPLGPLPHLPPPRALPAGRHLPARRHGDAPLPDLLQELPLRAADHERDAGDGRTSSRGWAKSAPTTSRSSRRPTAPTRSSSSTRRCASSAPAACAPATRSATPARSRSPAAASRRASPSAPAAPSTNRTATSAAPASTSARRRRCWRSRTSGSPRPRSWISHDLQLLLRRLHDQHGHPQRQGRHGQAGPPQPRELRTRSASAAASTTTPSACVTACRATSSTARPRPSRPPWDAPSSR